MNQRDNRRITFRSYITKMDLRSTLTMLKIEAFLGGNPLMKLNGTKWRFSKITYAVQAFYGTMMTIQSARIISELVQNKFLVERANIPQLWGTVVATMVLFQMLLFVSYTNNVTKGRCFSKMLENLCYAYNFGSKRSSDEIRYKALLCSMAPQLLITIVSVYIYLQEATVRPINTLAIAISSSALYATMSTILLCFKQIYKKINIRLDAMNSQVGLDDFDFARRISLLGMYYRKVRSAVDCYNEFFGIAFFLQLATTISLVLACLCEIIFTDFAVDLFNSTVPVKVICSIIVILCYDSVLEESEKSIFISLRLFERLPRKSHKRTAVSSFMQTCKTYAPVFSVFGLFRIKRSTILSFVNITATYLIVLIQSSKAQKQ